MNWKDFKTRLQQYPDLHLQFAYGDGLQVEDSYHITEIKQAPVTAVDCGGMVNAWTEIIIQLWEPPQQEPGRAMQVHKALKIVGIVESKLPLEPEALVKIEFGNNGFDARHLYPGDFIITGDRLIIPLIPDVTQCKAIGRNESCGTIPAQASDQVMPENACCSPGSGCC